MIVSVYIPTPNGKPMTVSDFIQLWFREIIIFGSVAVAIVVAGIHWLWRQLRPPKEND